MKDTAEHCVITIVGGNCTGHCQFNRGFYGLTDMPVVFQDKLDKVLERKTPAWQDGMIVVTRGTAKDHFEKLSETLKN